MAPEDFTVETPQQSFICVFRLLPEDLPDLLAPDVEVIRGGVQDPEGLPHKLVSCTPNDAAKEQVAVHDHPVVQHRRRRGQIFEHDRIVDLFFHAAPPVCIALPLHEYLGVRKG